MTIAYQDDAVTLHHGDCLDVLRELPDNSIDAVVTDPPYGINFMGKAWDGPAIAAAAVSGKDHTKTTDRSASMHAGRYDLSPSANQAFQMWCTSWSIECLRVLKPGGHLLAFGGSRTWHRLAAAVEDAGFEIRDSIAWLYGSGFPKSLDVAKAIDRAAGHRQTRGTTPTYDPLEGGELVTPDAQAWAGWGTALKPAFEPIVVGRKPLAGTVAGNVIEHGTGALNIDACRIDTDEIRVQGAQRAQGVTPFGGDRQGGKVYDQGRWPTNVVLDESQAAELDKQAPQTGAAAPASGPSLRDPRGATAAYGARLGTDGPPAYHGDRGGASRFFPTFKYEPKAPVIERPRLGTGLPTAISQQRCKTCGHARISASPCRCPQPDWIDHVTEDGQVTAHPTVKPLDLMRWLVRLVTPPGGLVLDPFAGSGTTAEACIIENLRCVTIELDEGYLDLIRARLTKPIQVGLDFDGGAA